MGKKKEMKMKIVGEKMEMNKKMNKKMDKKGVALEFLFWMILALIVLVVVVIGFMILTGKGRGALDFIKDIFRWG